MFIASRCKVRRGPVRFGMVRQSKVRFCPFGGAVQGSVLRSIVTHGKVRFGAAL